MQGLGVSPPVPRRSRHAPARRRTANHDEHEDIQILAALGCVEVGRARKARHCFEQLPILRRRNLHGQRRLVAFRRYVTTSKYHYY